jgi:hypothetical protein
MDDGKQRVWAGTPREGAEAVERTGMERGNRGDYGTTRVSGGQRVSGGLGDDFAVLGCAFF